MLTQVFEQKFQLLLLQTLTIYLLLIMLDFSYSSKKATKTYQYQPDFQPITITNYPKHPPLNKKTQKQIIRTNAYGKPNSKNKQKPIHRVKSANQKQWVNSNTGKGAFDNSLGKNQLARQQRNLRAEQRRLANSRSKKIHSQFRQDFLEKEEQINKKQMHIQKEKDAQIQKLKRVLEKQRKEKQKNDLLYEQKKRELQEQRKQLIKLQQDIQKHGPKQVKAAIQHKLVKKASEYPSNDRSKCYPEALPSSYKYDQPTQSQLVTNSRNILRQKQIEHLVAQRQSCLKNQPNINYTPSLIPLLSRASYKIISTHISTLVELFVDDLLIEQIHLLQQIQVDEQISKQKNKGKQMIEDYCQLLGQFVDEAQQIENKAGRYGALHFADVYKPKYKKQHYQPKFSHKQQLSQLQLPFDDDKMQETIKRSERFKRFVKSFDQYKQSYLNMFSSVTEEIIDQMVKKLAEQLDQGSQDFVGLVFRNQFK